MSSGADDESFASFTVAAGLTVRHLSALLGLDLWMVTCVDTASRSPRLRAVLEETGLAASGAGTGERSARDRQVVVASAGALAEAVGKGVELDWATSFCRSMVALDGPVVAPDVSLVPDFLIAQEASGRFGFGAVQAYAGVPLRWPDGTIFGTVCGYGLSVAETLDETAQRHLELLGELLALVLGAHERGFQRAQELEAARALAETDSLTALANRRGWESAVAREQDRVLRYGGPISVLAIDLDDLKVMNDRDGHARGDAELKALSEVLREICRSADVPARIGGDEFAVLAVEADVVAAKALATRLRLQLQRRRVRASVGVATRRTGEDLTNTIQRADAAMNVLKRRRQVGRRRVDGPPTDASHRDT
ncbi:MAG: GGDEF domain-containing protein [Nocardioidaceae bacterium]